MCRMKRVLRNAGWLLLFPEPSKEWPIRYGGWLYLLVGGVWVAIGFSYLSYDSPLRSFLGVSSIALVAWAAGIVFVALAALQALPANRRRARLGARVVLTLGFLALVPSYLPRFFDLGPSGGRDAAVVVALSWMVLVLSINYFVNRRRACRSSRSAA